MNHPTPTQAPATDAVHAAISRALDEAGIRNEVLRGMCLEVGLETFSDQCATLAPTSGDSVEGSVLTRGQKMRAAGFTPRDRRIECDECGVKCTPLLLPLHKCSDGENQVREQAALPGISEALTEMEARKDAAYLERNQVVAALAKAFPSGVARTAIDGWSEDWHGCVYIDLPTGQASWHFHDSQAHLFEGLPPYPGKWDGHSTEEKYARLAALAQGARQAAATGGDGGEWEGAEEWMPLGWEHVPLLAKAGITKEKT